MAGNNYQTQTDRFPTNMAVSAALTRAYCNSSFPRKRESTASPCSWMPAFAGMTAQTGQFEYPKKATVILCVAAFLFISTGCKKKADDQVGGQVPGPADGLVVELGVGIGQVKFGMSKDQITKHLGEPDKTEGKDMGLDYIASKGLSFLMHPTKGLISIDCWSKEYPFPLAEIATFTGRTKEGLVMGASRKEIETAYGQPSSVTTQGPLTVLHYDDSAALFTLKSDRLVKFSTYTLD